MVHARPSEDGKGVILHLRETDGKPTRIPLRDYLVSIVDLLSATRAASAVEVNVLEEEIRQLTTGRTDPGEGSWLEMEPYETRFIKLTFE